MIRNIQRTWFEVWGTEEAQNRFLKAILVFFIALSITQSIALLILALRKPPIFAVSQTESRILTVTPPRPELLSAEVKRAVTGYVSSRYSWDWRRSKKPSVRASKYVAPDFTKRFIIANQDQIRIAKDKKISQRFYVAESECRFSGKGSSHHGRPHPSGRGAQGNEPLIIEVQFDYAARTEINPRRSLCHRGERHFSRFPRRYPMNQSTKWLAFVMTLLVVCYFFAG